MDTQKIDAKHKRETCRHMTDFEKLQNAARLIEEMTGCRFNYQGGAFIRPGKNDYFTITMRWELNYKYMMYRIWFDASVQTIGCRLNANKLLVLSREIGQVHALLTALEKQKFKLTLKEMEAFYSHIRKRDE